MGLGVESEVRDQQNPTDSREDVVTVPCKGRATFVVTGK